MTDSYAPTPRAAAPRELTASFVVGTLTRHDAIATACRRHMDALRAFCAERGIRLRLRVYAFACEVDEPDFQRASTAAQVALDDHFQRSDLIVYEFGIVFSLYDSILLAPRPARVLVFHYGVTHPHVAPAAARPLLHKSYEQMRNLFAADEIFVTSRHVADELRRMGLPPERVTRIGLPAGVASGPPSGWPASRLDEPTRLLYVGRFVPAKGIADLIEALAIHRRGGGGSTLTLAGSLTFSDRSYVESLRALAAERGISDALSWRFDLPAAELSALYDEADALVIPSYHEGFCVPVVEAYQHGRAVIASDTTALPETTGGLGQTYPCGDVAALAERLTRLDLARRAGRMPTDAGELDRADWESRVAAHLDQYRPERIAAALAEVYERHLPRVEIEPVARRALLRARAEVLAEVRSGVAPLPSPLVERLQPLYDLLEAGPVPEFLSEPAAAVAAAGPPPPSRRRLAWIHFKRAVKRVPILAPAAVWTKRRMVAVLHRRHAAWAHLKRGVKRLPLIGGAAVQAKRALALPHSVRRHHALLQEVRHLAEHLTHRIEQLHHAAQPAPAATADDEARRLGHGRPAPVYAGRPSAGAVAAGWHGVHPAAFDGALRVAVGGGDRWSDHINVDSEGGEGADLVAEAHALPFPPGSVRELVVRSLPPGTTRHQFERTLVPHWAGLLAPHGLLRIHVRNPRAWLERIAETDQGGDDRPVAGAIDSWPEGILPAYVARVLQERGFAHVRVVAERWADGLPESEITAERRGAMRSSA